MSTSERLSPAMRAVLRRMGEGWVLWKGTAITLRSAWLQNPNKRGEPFHEDVSLRTFNALRDRGMVLPGPWHFPTMQYHLTERGKHAVDHMEKTTT